MITVSVKATAATRSGWRHARKLTRHVRSTHQQVTDGRLICNKISGEEIHNLLHLDIKLRKHEITELMGNISKFSAALLFWGIFTTKNV